jgi:hypothetical protein
MRPKNMGEHVHLSMLEPYSEIQISCHKHRFKHFNLQYIYLISYRNAKKAKPKNEIRLLIFENTKFLKLG